MALALAEAEIAFELRAGIDRRAAANLAQHAGLLEIVEISMDRHPGHDKAVGEIIEIDGLMLDEQIDDRLLAFFAFHLALRPVARNGTHERYNIDISQINISVVILR
ncbi:hypothetical protein thsrh120_32650 [Rhizobium sp. No.120]